MRSPSVATQPEVNSWVLPQDYVEFLSLTNGGEGWIGSNYIILNRFEELQSANQQLSFQEHLPDLFAFGSDGGDELFAFDFGRQPPQIVMVPVIFDAEDVVVVAGSFREFLERLEREDITDFLSSSSEE